MQQCEHEIRLFLHLIYSRHRHDAQTSASRAQLPHFLQALGTVDKTDHPMRVLTPHSDMTGVDRQWANRHEPGEVLHCTRGSKEHGIEPRSYAQLVATNPKENLVTRPASDLRPVMSTRHRRVP